MTLKWKDSKIIYILIIARTGHDTTAIALSNTVYYLAVNPVWFIRQPNPLEKCKCQSWLTTGVTQDIQQNAREVAITVLGDDKEDVYPTMEQTKELIYINQVMKEVSYNYLQVSRTDQIHL